MKTPRRRAQRSHMVHTGKSGQVSAPTACKLALTVALIHPSSSQDSSCKLFPCSRGGSCALKREPKHLLWFPPQRMKIEQQIHWFSSTKQAALVAMAVPALPARESQPSAVAGCEEDMGWLVFFLILAPAISAQTLGGSNSVAGCTVL